MPEIQNISSPIPQSPQVGTAQSRVSDVAGKLADTHIDTDFLLGKMTEIPKSLWTRIKGIFTKQVGHMAQDNLEYGRMAMASLKKDAHHILAHTGAKPLEAYGIGSRFTAALTLPDLTGEDVSIIAAKIAQSTLQTFENARRSGDSDITNSAYSILTSMDEEDISDLMAGQAMVANPDLSTEDALKIGKALYCGLISGLSAAITPEVTSMYAESAFDYSAELSSIRSALTSHQGAISNLTHSVEGLENPDWMDLLGEMGETLKPVAKREMVTLFDIEVKASQTSLDSVMATIQSISDSLEGNTRLSACTRALEKLAPYMKPGSDTLETASLFEEHGAQAIKAAGTANTRIREQLTALLDQRLDALTDDLESMSASQLESRLAQLDSATPGGLANKIGSDNFLSDKQKTGLREKIGAIQTDILSKRDGRDAAYASYVTGFNLLRRELKSLSLENLVARLGQLDDTNPQSLASQLAMTDTLSPTEKEDFFTLTDTIRREITDQFEQKTWHNLDTDAKQALMILASKGLLTDEFIAQVNGMFGTMEDGTISPLYTLKGEARDVVIGISQGREEDVHRLFATSWGSSRAETILHAFRPDDISHEQLVNAETALFKGKEELLTHLPGAIAADLGFENRTIDSAGTATRLSQTPVDQIIDRLIQSKDKEAKALVSDQNLAIYALAQLEMLIGAAKGSDDDFDARLSDLAFGLGIDPKNVKLDSIGTLAAKGFSGSITLARAMTSSKALVGNLARSLPQTLDAFRAGMARHPDMAPELMCLKTAEFFIRLGMADDTIKNKLFNSLDSLNVGFGDGRLTQVITDKLEADLGRVSDTRLSRFEFTSRLDKLEKAHETQGPQKAAEVIADSKRMQCLQMEFKALAGAIQADGIKNGEVLGKADIKTRIQANHPTLFQGKPSISDGLFDLFLKDYEDIGSLSLDEAKAKMCRLVQDTFAQGVFNSFIETGSTQIGIRSQLSGVLYHLIDGLKEGQTISASVSREHRIGIETPELISDTFLGGTSLELDFARMTEGTMAMTRTATEASDSGVKNAYACLVKPSSQTQLSLEVGLAQGMVALGVEGSVMKADGYIARFNSTRQEAEAALLDFSIGFTEGRPSLDPIDEIDFILDTETTFGAKAKIGIENMEFSLMGQDGNLDISAKARFSRESKGSTLITSSGNIVRASTKEYNVSLEGSAGIDDTDIAISASARFDTTIDTRVVTTRDGSVDESTQRVISAEIGDDPHGVLKTLASLGGGTTPELEAFLKSLEGTERKSPDKAKKESDFLFDALSSRQSEKFSFEKGTKASIHCSMTREAAQEITILRRRAKESSSTSGALFDRAMAIEQDPSSYVPVEVVIEQTSATKVSESIKPLLFVYTRTDSLNSGFVDRTKFDLMSQGE